VSAEAPRALPSDAIEAPKEARLLLRSSRDGVRRGHGPNADELPANRRLTRSLVQDLGTDPILPQLGEPGVKL
jgi:hypothetical protein